MNKEQIKAKKALLEYAKANLNTKVYSIRHINTHVEFLGLAGVNCAVFKQGWLDAELQVRDDTRKYPIEIIHNIGEKLFDTSLQPGEFCYTGYITTRSYGTVIACKIPKE